MAIVLRPECCDLAKTCGTASTDAFSLQYLEERTGMAAGGGHRRANRAGGFDWFNARAEAVIRIVPGWRRMISATLKPLLPNLPAMPRPRPGPAPTITGFIGDRCRIPVRYLCGLVSGWLRPTQRGYAGYASIPPLVAPCLWARCRAAIFHPLRHQGTS